jgi:hypothetical protein
MPSLDADSPQGRTLIVLLCGGVVMTSWPLPSASPVDMGLVDGLARLQLTARRLGCRIRLQEAGAQLSDLLILSGLAEILVAEPPDGSDGAGRPGWLRPG